MNLFFTWVWILFIFGFLYLSILSSIIPLKNLSTNRFSLNITCFGGNVSYKVCTLMDLSSLLLVFGTYIGTLAAWITHDCIWIVFLSPLLLVLFLMGNICAPSLLHLSIIPVSSTFFWLYCSFSTFAASVSSPIETRDGLVMCFLLDK